MIQKTEIWTCSHVYLWFSDIKKRSRRIPFSHRIIIPYPAYAAQMQKRAEPRFHLQNTLIGENVQRGHEPGDCITGASETGYLFFYRTLAVEFKQRLSAVPELLHKSHKISLDKMLPEKKSFHLTRKKCRFYKSFFCLFWRFFEKSLMLYSFRFVVAVWLYILTLAFGHIVNNAICMSGIIAEDAPMYETYSDLSQPGPFRQLLIRSAHFWDAALPFCSAQNQISALTPVTSESWYRKSRRFVFDLYIKPKSQTGSNSFGEWWTSEKKRRFAAMTAVMVIKPLNASEIWNVNKIGWNLCIINRIQPRILTFCVMYDIKCKICKILNNSNRIRNNKYGLWTYVCRLLRENFLLIILSFLL